VRIGVDVGSVRIGVARSDPAGTLAVPVETIDRRRGDRAAIARIAALVQEHEALEVVVGLPLTLAGARGPAADAAAAFAADLAGELASTPVVLLDERLSTRAAQRDLHSAGLRHKDSRSVIDQAAAAIVVQHALDKERATGAPAGIPVRSRSG
jgi:putative Holliday junction resolvase